MTTSSPSRVAGHLATLYAFALGVVPFLATTAYAEPVPASPPTVLPPAVVTATRMPTVAEQTAAAVTVITRAELEQAQIGDALSALKTVPGLNIADNGMPGQTAGVFMRGTESRHTVILLDGHRLPTGLQRYFDLGFFPLANIDRIEVVRGPLGSTQGGGALGGAINFITQRDVPDGPAGEITGEYGSFATGNAGLGVTAARNGVSANVGTSYFTTDNRRPNSEFTSASMLDTFGWEISQHAKLELLAGYLHRDGGTPGSGTQTTAADLDETLEQNLGFLSPGFTLEIGDTWTHSLNFSYARQHSISDKAQFNADNETTVVTRGLTYQAEFHPGETVAFQAGVERDWQGVNFVPTNGNTALPFTRNEREDAVFAGVQVQPLAGLTLLASARRDSYESFYGAANTWRYGMSYRVGPTGLALRASDGTAFAAPEIQNFVDFGFGALATTLRPERSRGQEVGFTQELGQVTFGATAFQSKTHDLAQFDTLTFTVKNIGLAEMSGVESFVECRFGVAALLRLNYTYLDAQDKVGNRPLTRRPRHTLGAEVHDEVARGWTLGAGVRAVADREDGFPQKQVPDYIVARVFTQYEVNKNLRLKLRVENLFNEQYAEVAGFPSLPRGIYGSVEWHF
ncbi:MAG: TonB-dependent receptor [Verrucomicrobiota bacterium]